MYPAHDLIFGRLLKILLALHHSPMLLEKMATMCTATISLKPNCLMSTSAQSLLLRMSFFLSHFLPSTVLLTSAYLYLPSNRLVFIVA